MPQGSVFLVELNDNRDDKRLRAILSRSLDRGLSLADRGYRGFPGTHLVGNPVNKNWWLRERDHQLLEEEELWRYY